MTFHNISDPYNMEPSPDPEAQSRGHSGEQLDLANSIEPRTPAPLPVPERQEESYFPVVTFDEAPGLEALSEVATSSNFHYRPASTPVPSSVGSTISPPPANTLEFLLNPSRSERYSTLKIYSCSTISNISFLRRG